MIKKYKIKPVEVEAIELTGTSNNIRWLGNFIEFGFTYQPYHSTITIPTLEGKITAMVGDYIIKGINGQFYPCKPDVFKKTYEEVDV